MEMTILNGEIMHVKIYRKCRYFQMSIFTSFNFEKHVLDYRG
jgi:hypothetical protein